MNGSSGYNVEVIADSMNVLGNRITTMKCTYWRAIHAEVMTHRAFSRNAASSRAIPIGKVKQQVRNNPAGPLRWGVNGKGMQDHGVLATDAVKVAKDRWLIAANSAVDKADVLESIGLHKQIVNRVLEPFMWMTTLITATDWQNFFALRVHKDAQPEFQYLSYLMLKAYVGSTPRQLEWGDWHLPYGDRLMDQVSDGDRVKVCVARAARVSYLTMDGQIDLGKDVELHDDLVAHGHWSPTEHPAQAMPGRHGNFNGFRQYRKTFAPNVENRTLDLEQRLAEYESFLIKAAA